MSPSYQKILLRLVLIFVTVFVISFAWLEWKSGESYEARTVLAIQARSQVAAEQLGIIVENIDVTLSSEVFRKRVESALYETSEEWRKFTLHSENVAGSVFEIRYREKATDPYALGDALRVVREEVYRAIAEQYDASEDVRILFLDSGILIESAHTGQNIFIAFVVGVLTVGAVEIILWQRRRVRYNTQTDEMMLWRPDERVDPESWRKDFERKDDGITFHKEVLVVDPAEQLEEARGGVSAPTVSIYEKPVQEPVTGAPPANLPVRTEDDARPTLYDSREGEGESRLTTRDARRPTYESATEVDPAVTTTPASLPGERVEINPEPTAQELKERLNKLLRGEL